MKILWLAPNFNHYKARFLNHLATESDIELTILSGTGRSKMGDQELEGNWSFDHRRLNVSKKEFGNSKAVKNELKSIFTNFDWVLIPAEKKNLPLFLFALKLRKANKAVRLFSYNHPILKSKNGKITFLDKLITKFYYNKLDRVIFYTEQSYDWAINNKLINSKKAFWANNTIDDFEVTNYMKKRNEPLDPPSMLLIGRLLKYRWIDRLFEYYELLFAAIPNLELHIIGGGPELYKIEKAISDFKNITYHGALVDEKVISEVMAKIDYVFVPGHSGLSINHAFAYEKPYISSSDYPNHPPEFNYLNNDVNSIILTGEKEKDIKRLISYLTDIPKYNALVEEVKKSKNTYSIENWVKQMVMNLEA